MAVTNKHRMMILMSTLKELGACEYVRNNIIRNYRSGHTLKEMWENSLQLDRVGWIMDKVVSHKKAVLLSIAVGRALLTNFKELGDIKDVLESVVDTTELWALNEVDGLEVRDAMIVADGLASHILTFANTSDYRRFQIARAIRYVAYSINARAEGLQDSSLINVLSYADCTIRNTHGSGRETLRLAVRKAITDVVSFDDIWNAILKKYQTMVHTD